MSSTQRLLLAFSLAVSWGMAVKASGVGNGTFQWKWANNMVSTDVTQCESYGVQVVALSGDSSSFGTPPYYMIAWKANGVPVMSPIGSDRDNLTWTVDQATGSSLILTVADSLGNAGGEAPSLYNVADGDSGCLPSAPVTNITLGANRTTSEPLETCDPLGLRVYGGQEPYTISIAAVGSPVVTNVTLGSDDDVFTWVNLADPNGQLILSVSDVNGTWGTSTGIFNTAGDAVTENTRCAVVASSGNSANVDQHPPQPGNSSHTTVIAATVVPIVVVCILAGLAFFLWRRRKLAKTREPEPAFLPDAWVGPSITDTGAGGGTYSPYDPPPSSKLERFRDEMTTSQSRPSTSQHGPGHGLLSPGMPQQGRTYSGHSVSGSMSGSHSQDGYFGGKGEPRLPPGVSPEWTVEPDILIQHRDGGAVQEIPPPYPTYDLEASPSNAPPPILASSPPAPAPSGGLSVSESTAPTSTSRPSSAGGPAYTSPALPEPSSVTADSSSTDPAPIYPPPSQSKGKGRELDLLS